MIRFFEDFIYLMLAGIFVCVSFLFAHAIFSLAISNQFILLD